MSVYFGGLNNFQIFKTSLKIVSADENFIFQYSAFILVQ